MIIFIKLCIVVLIILGNISYLPIFFNQENLPIFPYKNIFEIISIIAFFSSLLYRIPKSSFIKYYLYLLLVVSTFVLVYFSLSWNVSFSELRELYIPFIVLVIGSALFKTKEDSLFFRLLISVSVISSIIVAFIQIKDNIGSFTIEDQYLVVIKNSLGGLLSINIVLSVLELFNFNTKSRRYKLFLIISIIVMFLEMLTIRSRLAVVSAFLTSAFVSLKYWSFIKKRKIIIASIVFILLVLVLSVDSVRDFIISSFIQNREDNLLSGRDKRISMALSVIVAHPFTGNLFVSEYVPWVHNYLILKIFNYGLLLGLPWIVMYFYILCFIIKRNYSYKTICINNYGYSLVLVPFIISLGEPTFPYGPGTVNLMAYLLLGLSVESYLLKE